MGESEIGFFSWEWTNVLWNWEDYPIPAGTDLGLIRRNIEEALDEMGFGGAKEIEVFGDLLNHNSKDLLDAGIMYRTGWGLGSAVFKMPQRLIFCASSGQNLVVIAKQSQESELFRVLECLKSRNHPVLVLEPPTLKAFETVQGLVACTQFLGGRKPRRQQDPRYRAPLGLLCGNMGEEDPRSLPDLDFSKPITRRFETVVFWDVGDCPFPLDSTPDTIYNKIEKALLDRGHYKDMSIWAYVDENKGVWRDELRTKTPKTNLYFLPGGASRRNRMLNDMRLWRKDTIENDEMDEYDDPVDVIVVSNQFKDDNYSYDMLSTLRPSWRYNVFLVTPTQDRNEPDSPDWPRLLLDHVEAVHPPKYEAQAVTPESPQASPSESSERCPKRLKVDAAEETPEGS